MRAYILLHVVAGNCVFRNDGGNVGELESIRLNVVQGRHLYIHRLTLTTLAFPSDLFFINSN